ncbi:receptor-like protein 12 [Gossypium australe]|uniref:Receptor-like protein 12 n=1 Tax=Gossypium australe TaxID=47621 RepID=A0A5B6VSD2_9ROSI|nr:receptor-like protein 12 [Gossypium australe]
MHGRIPTPPPSLHWYGLSYNNFIGEIPSSICNLTSLMGFYLSENNLEGTIPECFRNLTSSLIQIHLQYNNFHGQIPEIFAEGCMLKGFRINNNELEGSLPQSLSNCKDLILLDVGNNNLNDTCPNWFGNLDQLQVLILRSNRFYGEVDSLDVTISLTHLRIIDLSHNNFSGYLPTLFFEHLHAIREGYGKKIKSMYMEDAIGAFILNYALGLSFTTKGLETKFRRLLSILTVINLSSNQLSGEIPKILGKLQLLIVLNLSHNCLIGPIPSSLGDLSELESLDLSSNKLEGRIPTELKNLGFLAVLNLSQNNLKGPIPQGKQFNTFANDSYMGNLDLCGLPLSKSCDTDEETPAKFDSDDDGDELNWKFSILMGYGCGLVLGMSMAYIVFTTGKPWWLIRIVERVRQRFGKRASLMAMFYDVFMIGALVKGVNLSSGGVIRARIEARRGADLWLKGEELLRLAAPGVSETLGPRLPKLF